MRLWLVVLALVGLLLVAGGGGTAEAFPQGVTDYRVGFSGVWVVTALSDTDAIASLHDTLERQLPGVTFLRTEAVDLGRGHWQVSIDAVVPVHFLDGRTCKPTRLSLAVIGAALQLAWAHRHPAVCR